MKHVSTFLIYGYHVIRAWLNNQASQVERLWVRDSVNDVRAEQLIALADDRGVAWEAIAKNDITVFLAQHRLSPSSNQRAWALIKHKPILNESALPDLLTATKQPLLLVLDGIQDPQNLGACLRNANAFGVHVVIAPKDKAAGITPVVMKVASGALACTPFIQVVNLARTLRFLKQQNIWLIGTSDQAAQTINEVDYTMPMALLMGNEGQGLRRLTQRHCDYLVNIPMLGTVSSLNVASACATALYEVQRQRQFL